MDTAKVEHRVKKSVLMNQQQEEKRIEYKGLCKTCENQNHCTFPRDASKPVFQCEEFKGQEISPVSTIEKFVSSHAKANINKKPLKDDNWSYRGLCRTCEISDTCVFPKPEGGVWHCEEYQ
ncbi:MAG: hypothetical protein RDV48_27470 [Candidatus Eremiobacteraeota bacterium]|nr:hypothetical protein [Candidatus Eremiobacteraeota bacterium]